MSNKGFESAKKEYLHPVEGKISGNIPLWVKGSLYMNGPGLLEIGPDRYNHLFDGLAMLQRYNIKDGKVYFNSHYVNSQTYHRNKASNRIVVSEFGTVAYPDPCRTIFDRFASSFFPEFTDNTLVTVYNLGDELFTATETSTIHRMDRVELTTLGSVRIDNVVAVNRATAHFHKDVNSDKTYVMGMINNPPQYALVSLPSIKKQEMEEIEKSLLDKKYSAEKLLTDAEVLVKVPVRWKFNPSYMHSFALTPNYFIILEGPLTISVYELMKSMVIKTTFDNAFKWWPNERTLIHVIDRKTGEPALGNIPVFTEDMFTFHHINAYEDEGHVVIDYCGYESGEIVTNLKLDQMKDPRHSKPSVKRLVVPLNLNSNSKNCQSTAQLSEDGSEIYITPELISDCPMELPTVNYGVYNGKKYRYAYGISQKVLKVDMVSKTVKEWSPEGSDYSSMECCFISNPDADPNNPEHEDYGILLCPVIFEKCATRENRYQSLYILDAQTLKELGRAEFLEVSIPMTFHGLFTPN